MEIIEVGAVLLAGRAARGKSEFASFVRPIHEPTLSAFCMGLTGIRQQEINASADFSKVFPRFLEWIGVKPYRLCSWGRFDLLQLKTDCARHGIAFPSEFSVHLDLKREFARLRGVPPCGIERALALSGLERKGRQHRAIDDARNIARLAAKVILPGIVAADPEAIGHFNKPLINHMKTQKRPTPTRHKAKRPKSPGPHYHPATGQILSEVSGGHPYVPKTPRNKSKTKRTVTIAPALRSSRDVFISRGK